ncbi:hypothetical protein F5Y06DRAFT_227028 [Hypoxylon sp. FL0890]|nr:hypothetical protein F5Y06DRAFT_227028 [Hypoxylon sp. FL0890]
MPLQKSLSEQNGSSRTRQHWNKSRSHSAASHSTTTRNAAPKPLQPILSEVSKNKLNAFKCQNPTKTNAQDVDTPVTSIEAPPNDGTDSMAQVEDTNPLSAAKESMTTPASRLVWQDLVGIAETKDEEEDTSPNERIGWDTREDPQHRLKLSPVMPGKRGKKRARSSSPVSSPASNSKLHTPAVNVEKLSRALKSPHADPALELWDRFSLSGSTSITPLGAMNSALAQIMVSSSPRPSRPESGLRRAISCGENWPKRRRVERGEATKLMETTIEESPSRRSKSSMVNALLQSVTGELNRSKAIQARQDALKSPSPKKKRPQPMAQTPSSPTRPKSPAMPAPPLSTENNVAIAQKTGLEASVDVLSDYGDDDFDDDTLMELDASLRQPQEVHTENDSLISQADTGQIPDQQQSKREPASFDDEFADMDDDVFAAAEDLITQIDSSRPSRDNPHTPAQPAVIAQERPIIVTDDHIEDVFGDDFGGDFDFDAAEIAATQSASSKQMNGSLPPVRR